MSRLLPAAAVLSCTPATRLMAARIFLRPVPFVLTRRCLSSTTRLQKQQQGESEKGYDESTDAGKAKTEENIRRAQVTLHSTNQPQPQDKSQLTSLGRIEWRLVWQEFASGVVFLGVLMEMVAGIYGESTQSNGEADDVRRADDVEKDGGVSKDNDARKEGGVGRDEVQVWKEEDDVWKDKDALKDDK